MDKSSILNSSIKNNNQNNQNDKNRDEKAYLRYLVESNLNIVKGCTNQVSEYS